jgi:hypothetical protein
VAISHILLSGLCFLAAAWHWVFWDLDCFRDPRSGLPALDLPKILGTCQLVEACVLARNCGSDLSRNGASIIKESCNPSSLAAGYASRISATTVL